MFSIQNFNNLIKHNSLLEYNKSINSIYLFNILLIIIVYKEAFMSAERNKGSSIIVFPQEYVVFDLETTGLDPNYDNVIEIGAIKYKNGKEVDRYQSLIQPYDFDIAFEDDQDYAIRNGEKVLYVADYITKLTGITNKMLENAPTFNKVADDILSFFGNAIVFGYNVNFDINFLYDAIKQFNNSDFQNDYVDVMRLARKVHHNLNHHRLKDMVAFYNIVNEQSHRALGDAKATQDVFEHLYKDAINLYGDEEGIIASFKKHSHGKNYNLQEILKNAESSLHNADNPIFNKNVCITGKLEKFPRKDALQIIANIGGIPQDSVTKETNYLVLGNLDLARGIKDGKSSKQKKAERLVLAGKDIEIISENAFYDFISDFLKE